MNTLPALPDVAALEALTDPAARILALVEPATAYLALAAMVDDAREIKAKASAIEVYARHRGLADEAIGAAQTIGRRAEVRMGELMPSEQGKRQLHHSSGEVRQQERSALREMANHADEVEVAIKKLAPNGHATRNRVMETAKALRRAAEADDDAALADALEHHGIKPLTDPDAIAAQRQRNRDLGRLGSTLDQVVELFEHIDGAQIVKCYGDDRLMPRYAKTARQAHLLLTEFLEALP